jgi:hypothetical protein
MIICKNLDKGFHIVSKKFLVNTALRIFVFLNEATLRFFSPSVHFRGILDK